MLLEKWLKEDEKRAIFNMLGNPENHTMFVARVINHPRFKLKGWRVKYRDDLCHDGHMAEFAWEHLIG